MWGPFSRAVLISFGIALYVASGAAQAAVVLRDDLKREVTFATSPRRIVTLLPSLTETVCAVGACDRLVATDRFSNWPAQAMALPKVGGQDDAAVETIVSLRPDLVLSGHAQRLAERLRQLGIQTFELDTRTYADIGRTVKLVGRIVGMEARAALLEQDIDRAVAEIGAKALARHAALPTVYFEVDRTPYAAGRDSFIGELLARLGTRNIVSADLGVFPKLNPEYVVQHDPDVIFVSPTEAPHLADRPGWGTLRAVQEHRLCFFPPEVHDTIVRPGPRVPEGMRALAECLLRVAP